MFAPLPIAEKAFRPYGEECRRFNAWLALSQATLGVFACLLFAVPTTAGPEQVRILALGDSLTAGYGLSQSDTFPSQLSRRLRDAGVASEIVNAGVSGDTTSGALQRLDWLMGERYDLAIVELGANDALRAVDPDLTRQNLEKIVEKLKATGSTILLAGMKAPRNLGDEYTKRFDALFPEIARWQAVYFYPFFLDGVATDPALNQADGLHPNAKGVAIITERMLPFVLDALEKDRK